MIQKVYVFFSSSTHRWQVVFINISNLTVKNLSQTRWGCRIEALKPFRYRIGEIYDALFEIVQDTNLDSINRHEAECLCKHILLINLSSFVLLSFGMIS